jgi:hypothetical protein
VRPLVQLDYQEMHKMGSCGNGVPLLLRARLGQ